MNKVVSTFLALLVLTTGAIGVELYQIKSIPPSHESNVGAAVATSQENLGYAVSTTVASAGGAFITTQVSPQRQVRYYGAFFNNSTPTLYLFLGPSSTAINGIGIPIPYGASYELSAGKGNLYFGAVSVPTSTATGSYSWVEKFKP